MFQRTDKKEIHWKKIAAEFIVTLVSLPGELETRIFDKITEISNGRKRLQISSSQKEWLWPRLKELEQEWFNEIWWSKETNLCNYHLNGFNVKGFGCWSWYQWNISGREFVKKNERKVEEENNFTVDHDVEESRTCNKIKFLQHLVKNDINIILVYFHPSLGCIWYVLP
jgi:hypothetical protein